MAEYIERKAVAKKAINMHGFGGGKYVPLSAIMNLPAADVVEVVRCKDCRFCKSHVDQFSMTAIYCTKHWGNPEVDPDDFCSYGERREQDA